MKTMRAPISPKKTLWVTGFVILALAAFFLLRPVFQPKVECISLFSYLSGQSVEAVTLNLDLQAVYGKDSADFPAVLSWVEKDGKNISLPVEISVRGKNRRDVCTFPPLKLSVAETKELGISKGGSKLVTHCTEGNGETLLMREYLAYRLYAGLTDASFRTRLIKVTYQDRARSCGCSCGLAVVDGIQRAERIIGIHRVPPAVKPTAKAPASSGSSSSASI